MALETTQDGGIGSEGAIADAAAVRGMAGGGRQSALGFVEALRVFEVMVFVDLGDVGDSLRAGAEGPAIFVAREGGGVVGFGLRGGDSGMTNSTGRRPGWIGGL